MKNIFILIDDISHTGGTERVACILCNEFSRMGYSVFLYSLNYSKNTLTFELDNNVTLKTFQGKKRYLSLIKIMKHIKQQDGCLITISMGRLSVDVALASIIHKPKKIIFSEHISFESFSLVKQKIKKLAYYFASKVIFLTENDKNIFRNDTGKYDFIRNINPYFQSGLTIRDFNVRKNIAIAVGRLTYQKDFESLINIWKSTKTKDWELLIIGDGEDYSKLKSIISDNDNIRLIPATSDISSYYNCSKLFLMTSRYEGLPMVLIESQFFGVPSIAYNCKTGPKEIIKDKSTGYIIPYGDNASFSTKLSSLIFNDELLYKMHKNALKNKDEFSPKKIMKKWIDIVSE
ncbi:glycosyltransferase [Providencia heimbachae]|uniref:Glycosyltransferase n=1 Tax=Providencia heimbachae ATCC 35613 TaxID=1354272 RepID=A0A1B7JXM8_9GAMM|nr:glycosyltransferase [Providencia heimbachae]OAT52669.1 glycosyltransferase [Providencia heimbachae ATCC 35613]SQH14823.1 Probable poly(glycerol-phosphate) alpha-glucosyltransferase [Providencia heimbachae]